jgi:2OG-Fe(II) oxygenase superfamily
MTSSVAVSGTVLGDNAYDNDNENPDDDDSSSVDTNDALLEMLGLAPTPPTRSTSQPTPTVTTNTDSDGTTMMTSILVMDDDDIDDDSGDKNTVVTSSEPLLSLLKATPIRLPPKCSRYGPDYVDCTAVIVDDFLTISECQDIIQQAQQQGQQQGNANNGFQYVTHASHVAPDQSHYKVQLQTPNPHKLAILQDTSCHVKTMIWNRLQQQLSMQEEVSWMKSWQHRHGPIRGLNPRLRILQYDAMDDDRFEPHFDATTRVGGQYASRITVLIYLNHGDGIHFQGGETRFLNHHISSNYNNNNNKSNHGSKETVITPQTGRLVMFEHDLYHAGAPLTWGTKYVLRTDILFDDKEEEEENTTQQQQQHTSCSATSSSSTDGKEDNNTMDTTTPTTTTRPTTGRPSCCSLVIDVCQSLGWTPSEQTVLEDMGVLYGTLESFLVPGIDSLTQLLLEAGISQSQIQHLLQVVQEQVQS